MSTYETIPRVADGHWDIIKLASNWCVLGDVLLMTILRLTDANIYTVYLMFNQNVICYAGMRVLAVDLLLLICIKLEV